MKLRILKMQNYRTADLSPTSPPNHPGPCQVSVPTHETCLPTFQNHHHPPQPPMYAHVVSSRNNFDPVAPAYQNQQQASQPLAYAHPAPSPNNSDALSTEMNNLKFQLMQQQVNQLNQMCATIMSTQMQSQMMNACMYSTFHVNHMSQPVIQAPTMYQQQAG